MKLDQAVFPSITQTVKIEMTNYHKNQGEELSALLNV